jgi:hypothetical protein
MRPIAAYKDEGARYLVQFLSGTFLPYRKSDVERIEEIPQDEPIKAERE